MTFDSSFSLRPVSSPGLNPAESLGVLPPSDSTVPPLCFGPENSLVQTFLPEHFFPLDPALFPLFLYGPSSCGKSELALYIAHNISPATNVYSFCLSDFYRNFIDAIELNQLKEFRASFTSENTVLLIDNFEQVINRPSLFNELIFLLDNCPKLIITSTLHPSDLNKLPYQITSRIFSGLSIPLDNPSSITKKFILKNEILKLGTTISDPAASWLVNHFGFSLPEIKQVVSKLRIHHDFSKPIERPSLLTIFHHTPGPPISLNDIANIVSKKQKLKTADLISQSRKRSIILARGLAIFIARKFFQYKYDEIGRFFGNRDHTTVLHAYRKTSLSVDKDHDFKILINDILSDLKVTADSFSV
ncbi:MAG: helix-turn-helix domain-containing protein [Planctomycetota bacterium]|nr:helix-turn-helix domain-containing protein [Planctomycetota bacterium]